MKEIHFLNQTYSKSTIEKLISCMEDCRYSPGEVIFNEGDKSEINLFYIVEGEVSLFYNR